MSTPDPILPGATLGVLGSGQLGRMFAIAARRMGYRVHTYSPGEDTPTGHISDRQWNAPYEDLDEVKRFAQCVDVVTFEFENVLSETAEAAASFAPVRPHGSVLHTTQNRLREKEFLSKAGIPLPPFRPVHSLDDLREGLAAVGCPAVLKTAGWGYDGKGQQRIEDADEASSAFENLKGAPGVLEGFVDFAAEGSVVAARGLDGQFEHFGLFENIHVNHILDLTMSPGRLDPKLEGEAVEIARTIFEALDVVGVMCVEFFITAGGSLLVNELAPRPHNSGHVTFDNCVTSQFEQQVRAICGLPLGGTTRISPAVMANLLGELWEAGAPRWDRACAFPNVKLHLYGKADARPGRKMGHLTALAPSIEEALADAVAARDALVAKG